MPIKPGTRLEVDGGLYRVRGELADGSILLSLGGARLARYFCKAFKLSALDPERKLHIIPRVKVYDLTTSRGNRAAVVRLCHLARQQCTLLEGCGPYPRGINLGDDAAEIKTAALGCASAGARFPLTFYP